MANYLNRSEKTQITNSLFKYLFTYLNFPVLPSPPQRLPLERAAARGSHGVCATFGIACRKRSSGRKVEYRVSSLGCRVMMLMLELPFVDCNKGNLYRVVRRADRLRLSLSTCDKFIYNLIWWLFRQHDNKAYDTTVDAQISDFSFPASPAETPKKKKKNITKTKAKKSHRKLRGPPMLNQIEARGFILFYCSVRLVWQLDWQNSAENSHAVRFRFRFKIQISNFKISGCCHISFVWQRNQFQFSRGLLPPAAAAFFNFYFSTSSRPVNCFICHEAIPSQSYFPRLAEAVAYVKLIRHKINFELCA